MTTQEEFSDQSKEDYQGKDIPKNNRKYVKPGEAVPESASRTYIGPDGGMFYDGREVARADTTAHIKAQGDPKGKEDAIFAGLTNHPEHAPDIVEWDNGEIGPSNEPPEKEEGEEKAKVEKVVERNRARTISGKLISLDATDVHVNHNPDERVQAKYRNKDGKLVAVIHQAALLKEREEHWDDYDSFLAHKKKLSKALNNLAKNPEEMDDADAIIYIIGKTALRHGHRSNPDARGGSTLQVRDITIEGEDTVHFALPTKAGMFTEFSKKDPALVKILRPRMEGKNSTDRIFDSGQQTNNARLRKHLGGKGVDGVSMKSLRTDAATSLALDEVKKLIRRNPGRAKTKTAYNNLRNEIGLRVGTLLGHKRQTKDDEGNLTDPPEYEFTGATALGSYISPRFDEQLAQHFAPEEKEQNLNKAFTPDWTAKGPDKERDIDKYAEARKRKGENRQWGIKETGGDPRIIQNSQPTTWMDSLIAQGFIAPMIKEVTSDGTQMWFLSNGIDYIANLGTFGNVFVEKAVFKPVLNLRKISRKPTTPSEPVISLTDDMIEDAQ